jgi:hypothetical protein
MRSFILRSVLAGATIAAAMVAPACTTTDRGGLYVILRTEMLVGDDIDNVQIRVIHAQRGEVARADVKLGLGGFFLPSSMAVAPSQSGKEGPYTIRVIGSLKGQPKTFREVVTDIPRTFLSSLEMPLEYLCYEQAKAVGSDAASTCPNGQTCMGGECAPVPTIDPANLPRYDEPALGLTRGATCFDALACFAAPTLLDVNLDTCRVAKPAATYTLGLMLPASGRGVPFMGKKLIAFDVDGPSGAREEAGQLVLPSGICRALRANPGALLVASTTCAKRVVMPICATSTDAGGLDAPDAVTSDTADAVTVDAAVEASSHDVDAGPVDTGVVLGADADATVADAPEAVDTADTVPATDADAVVDAAPVDLGVDTAECSSGARRCLGATPQACAAGSWQSEATCANGCVGAGVCEQDNASCWGDPGGVAATTPKLGNFRSLSSGRVHTCGIKNDGTVDCWGLDGYGQATPKPGVFQSITSGAMFTCGLRVGGAVECWGDNRDGQSTPLGGSFTSIAAGDTFVCGIRSGGSVECWGRSSEGQTTPKPGSYTALSGGFQFMCGLMSTSLVECWGYNIDGQATPKGGTFMSISAAYSHVCGLRADRTADCWGYNSAGETVPKAGAFDSIASAAFRTCGIRSTGAVECWGSNSAGQAAAKTGPYSQLTGGDYFTCALAR